MRSSKMLKQLNTLPLLSIQMQMILLVRRFARLCLVEAGMTCGSAEIMTPAVEGTLGILQSVLKDGYLLSFVAQFLSLIH
jgi:hypothetical protein